MATLIPPIGNCAARMTPCERQLAERLEQKLGDDYLLWYDLPVGPQLARPDFMVLHPRRGLLVLEVRDWSLKTIHRADTGSWQLFSNKMFTTRPNPAQEAKDCAQQVADALMRDAQLLNSQDNAPAKLRFPWSYGVVFPKLTRQDFSQAKLERFIEPRHVLCGDEMLEAMEPQDLQSRLWDMFPLMMGGVLTPALMERVRWILFPELRQGETFDDRDGAALPEVMPVMDLAQERLARGQGGSLEHAHGTAGAAHP